MSGQFYPTTPPSPAGSVPPAAAPGGSSRWWIWLLAIGGLLFMSPFCCCGGLLVYASTFRDFALSNGQHLGGPPMNVRFDYEVRTDRLMVDAFYLVCRSADGTTRERNLFSSFSRRGTMHFSAVGLGPAGAVRGPVQVWIEKEDLRGRRSRASNTLTIYAKS